MSNDYFVASGVPATGATGSSSVMRGEISAVETGFNKLPAITASGGYFVRVNAGATALESIALGVVKSALSLVIGADIQAWSANLDVLSAAGYTGTGAVVRAISPTFTGTAIFSAATFSADSAFNSTGAVTVPNGTTAQRPANGAGKIRYNSTTGLFEGYGSAWGTLGGGATGAGSDQVFQENARHVTAPYTLTTGKSAMTVGPLIIDTGGSLTVPSGERVVVL